MGRAQFRADAKAVAYSAALTVVAGGVVLAGFVVDFTRTSYAAACKAIPPSQTNSSERLAYSSSFARAMLSAAGQPVPAKPFAAFQVNLSDGTAIVYAVDDRGCVLASGSVDPKLWDQALDVLSGKVTPGLDDALKKLLPPPTTDKDEHKTFPPLAPPGA